MALGLVDLSTTLKKKAFGLSGRVELFVQWSQCSCLLMLTKVPTKRPHLSIHIPRDKNSS
jgi:hypothetical protein